MYQQILDPLGGSLGWSAAVAALPLIVLFALLGIFKVRAWAASLIGLALAWGVAVIVYEMPVSQATAAASEGAAFGLFPAMWIVVNAIWIYEMTTRSGHFEVLKRSFAAVSSDRRIQGIIIAFCFGALLEALAGFGTPVAICAVMLIAIGLTPLKAAAAALVANTAPVAYGAVALPIITLAQVTGLDERDLSQMTGRQVPLLALIVPFVLLGMLDGRRGLREVWPVALVCGFSFGATQFAMANYGSVQLADIAASLVAAGTTLLFLRTWQPRRLDTAPAGPADSSAAPPAESAGGSSPVGDADLVTATRVQTEVRDRTAEQVRAFAPYLIVVALFSIANITAVKDALAKTTQLIEWPVLDVRSPDGEPITMATFKLDWLASGGTILLISGLLTAAVLRLRPSTVVDAYRTTVRRVRTAGVTVMAVLALAYVMNASGETVTIGAFLANAGQAFAVLSPLVGWFGVAVSGSDTSSNSLFGGLQVSAAEKTGLDPVLMASSNATGGVLGKMISPQNLAIGAAAVGLAGREGELFRKVLVATAILLPIVCLLVVLQASPVLSWMVP